jgi:hypothetical protein
MRRRHPDDVQILRVVHEREQIFAGRSGRNRRDVRTVEHAQLAGE